MAEDFDVFAGSIKHGAGGAAPAQGGGKKKFTKTNIRLRDRKGKPAKPSPSGLLGPVRIVRGGQ